MAKYLVTENRELREIATKAVAMQPVQFIIEKNAIRPVV